MILRAAVHGCAFDHIPRAVNLRKRAGTHRGRTWLVPRDAIFPRWSCSVGMPGRGLRPGRAAVQRVCPGVQRAVRARRLRARHCRQAERTVGSPAQPAVFDPDNAAYYLDTVDPPITASFRASLKSLKIYNEALVGLTNGEAASVLAARACWRPTRPLAFRREAWRLAGLPRWWEPKASSLRRPARSRSPSRSSGSGGDRGKPRGLSAGTDQRPIPRCACCWSSCARRHRRCTRSCGAAWSCEAPTRPTPADRPMPSACWPTSGSFSPAGSC